MNLLIALLLTQTAGVRSSNPNPGAMPFGGGSGVRAKSSGGGLPSAPLFSFASPTNYNGYPAYAGLPATDGCKAPSTVTGSKGEALTFTRATTRFCPADANETSGTMCASGEVCLQSRGISIYRAGTNTTLRSEEFDNAAWASNNSGVALPTVTANASVAPDGTTTADRIQIPAVTAGQYSQLYQLNACPAGTQNPSIWVKGNGAAGDFHFKIGTTCSTCTYANGVWARCKPGIAAAGNLHLAIANDGPGCGANDAVDAFIWGAQCEAGTYATPYVATTSASATRNAETAAVTVTLPYSAFSAAATNTRLPIVGQDMPWLSAGATTDAYALYVSGGTTAVGWGKTSGGNTITTAAVSPIASARMYAVWLGAGSTNMPCYNGTCATPAAITGTPAASVGVIYLGYGGAGHALTGGYADGIGSDFCWDSSTTRCR
jgi:hypothetical protein